VPRQLSVDWLRTFVLVSELGSIAGVARRLGQPPGSLGFHIRRLEEEVGTAVYRRHRHGIELTEAGTLLLEHARRLLDLHDDTLESILALGVEGAVRLGLPQDVEARIMPLLARFARLHVGVRVETRVDRSPNLIGAVERGGLDLALGFGETGHGTLIETHRLAWIAAAGAPAPDQPLPLVLLEAPCVFRDVALFNLDQAGIAWRIAFTSPSLSSLWRAVRAGLGVTVRTTAALPDGLDVLDGLPVLPSLGLLALVPPGDPSAAAKRLRGWLLERLDDTGLSGHNALAARPRAVGLRSLGIDKIVM
jgi:DNA-binding transcriptional LysR family regulator